MKKIIALLLACTMVIGLFAACGGSSEKPATLAKRAEKRMSIQGNAGKRRDTAAQQNGETLSWGKADTPNANIPKGNTTANKENITALIAAAVEMPVQDTNRAAYTCSTLG